MSVMLYQAGGDTKIWGRKLKTKVVAPHEVEDHVADGWYAHPHDVPEEELVGVGVSSSGSLSSEQVADMGEVSDGYHTFNELYDHRVRLFSTLMNAYPHLSWWSRKHSDGEEFEGWILAGITTPDGDATYHLPDSEIEFLPAEVELDLGKEWDGHEAKDVLERLLSLRPNPAEPEPEPEPEPEKEESKPKRGRKPKADTDGDND